MKLYKVLMRNGSEFFINDDKRAWELLEDPEVRNIIMVEDFDES